MWLAVAVGAYSRLRGLGTWPLATDEYYIARSVGNILQHGVPAFDCGGYYMRALTLQYSLAPLYALGLSAEFAGRLVTVACSFAVLPAVYLLGKRLSGVTVACVSVALLSLSLWEIEFARFARMYMPFQAIFVWYLLALHRVVVDRRESAYGWMWLLSVVGVFTWEGGFFLLVINFVPSLIERAPSRARHLAMSLALLILGYLYNSLNFRFMGSQPAYPPDVPVHVGGSSFIMPPLLASTLSTYPAWLVGALAIFVICLVAIVKLARAPGTVLERLTWAGLIILSLLNLFGCVLIGLMLALLLGWLDVRRTSRRCLCIASVPIAASFGFWAVYAWFTNGWYQLFPTFGPGGELSKLAVVLFKFPNVFNSILFPWLAAVPALTAVFGGLTALAAAWAILAKDGERLKSLRLTLAVGLLMAAMIGIVETKYTATRYTFFLLPVLYLVAVTAIYTLFVRPVRSRPKRGMVLGLAILAVVGFTEDFGWAHMMHIDSVKWNYRLPLNWALTAHYYPRRDYRTPAEYVNRRASPNAVIITTAFPVAYYLKRTDYMYINFRSSSFAEISCDRGQRERWTGARLLYRKADLFNVIDKAPGNVWLIAGLRWHPVPGRLLKPPYSAKVVYRGLAKIIVVYKITHSR